MGIKAAIGVITLGVSLGVAVELNMRANQKIAKLEELKTPIGWVVLQDAGRFCAAHGGIKDLHRTAKDFYDIQCKDEAWFLKLKLQPQPLVIKPAITLKEIM